MKSIMAILCGTAALALSAAAVAAPVTTDYSKIVSIDTYSGDTTIALEKNPPGCPQGFWMRPDQPGFKDKLTVFEQAAHQNARVKVIGDDAHLWNQLDGSKPDQRNCRVERVSFEPTPNIGARNDTDGAAPVDVRKERAEEEKLSIPEQKALQEEKARARGE